MSASFETLRADLAKQIQLVEQMTRENEAILGLRIAGISGWSVSQHFDHTLKIDRLAMAKLLENKKRPTGRIKLIGWIALKVGHFPRGRAKAPDGTEGQELCSADILAAIKQTSTEMTEALAKLEPQDDGKPWMRHPFFGPLTLKEWMRSLAVHHHHHMKIVRDIIAASSPKSLEQ